MMNSNDKAERSSGQAMIEFVVGLVAILVLVVGMLEIARLGRTRLELINRARGAAARAAVAESYSLMPPGPRYLRDWRAGPDRRHHSADDVAVPGGASLARDDLAPAARPGRLRERIGPNPVSELATGGSLLESSALVHGRATRANIPLYPLTRRLLYNVDSIALEADAWLIWTRGIN